ncbi:MAG: gamma-glutamyl-gamma-aminobutyrate hydrolase family protein, partial [SAR324 cluster bacterium]|nr:gamma-glutamyl-gamma-aminobutyrate hydrolase family protein [SAR324 cluster bacterium]
MLLVVDNGSIYTKNLIDFLSDKKIEFASQKVDQVSLPDMEKFHSFILSGRRANDRKMNAINSKIIKHAVSEKKSLLGICYGAEILAITLGGTIKKSDKHVKGEETVVVENKNEICDGEMGVTESHKYEISQLGSEI